MPPTRTPCHRCPKWKLYPENYGLDPANELAVQIYRDAREEVRVGTFAGAPLLRTLTPAGVGKMLDEYDHLFANSLDRFNTFQKVMAIDRVATEVIGAKEEVLRQAAEAAARRDKLH